jgi:UDP-glucose:(heptosyl)LPS alpha-1,3-glucosyltransferase
MGNRVHVWPAQRDVAPFYAAADLCVFPTTGDAFGMVPLEAMSYGLPVILSGKRYCGFAEFIQDGEDALVLDDPDNAADIAAAIDRLLSDPTLYTQLAKAGLALAGHMSWPQAAARYAALYHEVVNETQPARQSYAKG